MFLGCTHESFLPLFHYISGQMPPNSLVKPSWFILPSLPDSLFIITHSLSSVVLSFSSMCEYLPYLFILIPITPLSFFHYSRKAYRTRCDVTPRKEIRLWGDTDRCPGAMGQEWERVWKHFSLPLLHLPTLGCSKKRSMGPIEILFLFLPLWDVGAAALSPSCKYCSGTSARERAKRSSQQELEGLPMAFVGILQNATAMCDSTLQQLQNQ